MELTLKSGIKLDDFATEKDEDLSPYWTQICESCASKLGKEDGKIDEGAGQGICGVAGCDKEASHYLDITENNIRGKK